MSEFVPITDKSIHIEEKDLKIEKAIDFSRAANKSDRFLSEQFLVKDDGKEVIVGSIHVPLGQQPINDIRYTEKLAILFDPEDKFYPMVFALREDFPKLPHQNLLDFEKPRSLCIYEKTYADLRLDWRSIQFIQDITNWLYLSAYGELHQEDQPLEPLLLWNDGTIIIPTELNSGDALHMYGGIRSEREVHLLATKNEISGLKKYQYMSVLLAGKPREHGIIESTPRTLSELHKLLSKCDINLLDTIKIQFLANKHQANCTPLFIVNLPSISHKNKSVTEFDNYVFWAGATVEEIGVVLKIWQKHDGHLAELLSSEMDPEEADKIKIGILKPLTEFSKQQAVLFNKTEPTDINLKVAQIGVGALGSQIFMGLSRIGFGKWEIIDEDVLLPHNLARHYLNSDSLNWSKSQAVSFQANSLLNDNEHSSWIWDNLLYPKNSNRITEALNSAELIIDISTSIAVEREICELKYGKARRICIFLNPVGKDLVILAENHERQIPLNVLEFQFYKGLINNGLLHDHMYKEMETVRYSNSCRDISNRISNDHVTLLSSIAVNWVKKINSHKQSKIGLWRINEKDISVGHIDIPVADVDTIKSGDWEIFIDHDLISKISASRFKKLPNETGGILVGGYDMLRKRIYVMETILSPNDSHEYPNAYIRGIKDVKLKLGLIQKVTDNNLKYIGEWHSHPKGASLNKSEDDKNLFNWLENEMDLIGLPPLMIILGDKKKYRVYTK